MLALLLEDRLNVVHNCHHLVVLFWDGHDFLQQTNQGSITSSVLHSTLSGYWSCQWAVDQKCSMIPVCVRPTITDDFTITTICLQWIPSFAGTLLVQVPKWDPLKENFGSVSKNSLAAFVFFDTMILYVGEAVSSCIFNLNSPMFTSSNASFIKSIPFGVNDRSLFYAFFPFVIAIPFKLE